jgi:ATP-dependent protease ClpP protease subunit
MKKELKFYGNIGGGGISPVEFSDNILRLENAGTKELTIHMHSYGGSVFDGNVIYNALLQNKMKVKIIVDGIAASMASIILLAADEVEVAENGFIMIHRPFVSVSNGDSEELLQTAKLLKDMEKEFARCYARKTGRSEKEFISTWLDGKDHWLNADEAVKYGFAARKIKALAKDPKRIDKELFSKLEVKNIYDRYAASLNIKNESKMKKKLIELLQLEGVTETSSDDEVLEKVKEKLSGMEKASKEGVEASVNALISSARKEGKMIPENMAKVYREVGMKSGLSVLTEVLASIRPPVSIMSMIKPDGKKEGFNRDKSQWTLEDYRKYDPKAFERNPKLFDELYKKEFQD